MAFIRKAAQDLSELVNDLLDLAKVEAGKIVGPPGGVRGRGALRRAARHAAAAAGQAMRCDSCSRSPSGCPRCHTDEGKVSQILRNFISNALKFTEQGEIRVSAVAGRRGDSVVFAVADTGIGIAPEDQEPDLRGVRPAREPVQGRVKGTGLGLPLCRQAGRAPGRPGVGDEHPGAGLDLLR